MSDETVLPDEPETPEEAVSELASTEEITFTGPLTTNVPSGSLAAITGSGLVNFYYPYLPQAANAVLSGISNATVTGTVVVYNVSSVGWSSVNNAGFVFQNDQYNSRREGGGQ